VGQLIPLAVDRHLPRTQAAQLVVHPGGVVSGGGQQRLRAREAPLGDGELQHRGVAGRLGGGGLCARVLDPLILGDGVAGRRLRFVGAALAGEHLLGVGQLRLQAFDGGRVFGGAHGLLGDERPLLFRPFGSCGFPRGGGLGSFLLRLGDGRPQRLDAIDLVACPVELGLQAGLLGRDVRVGGLRTSGDVTGLAQLLQRRAAVALQRRLELLACAMLVRRAGLRFGEPRPQAVDLRGEHGRRMRHAALAAAIPLELRRQARVLGEQRTTRRLGALRGVDRITQVVLADRDATLQRRLELLPHAMLVGRPCLRLGQLRP
jgi:hypothetical protein